MKSCFPSKLSWYRSPFNFYANLMSRSPSQACHLCLMPAQKRGFCLSGFITTYSKSHITNTVWLSHSTASQSCFLRSVLWLKHYEQGDLCVGWPALNGPHSYRESFIIAKEKRKAWDVRECNSSRKMCWQVWMNSFPPLEPDSTWPPGSGNLLTHQNPRTAVTSNQVLEMIREETSFLKKQPFN